MPGHTWASDLQKCWCMANQARQLEAASSKQNRNPKLAEVKELKRPPLKPVPPPDEDVLYYLPIG